MATRQRFTKEFKLDGRTRVGSEYNSIASRSITTSTDGPNHALQLTDTNGR